MVDEPIQTYTSHMLALLIVTESLADHEEYSTIGEKRQCPVRRVRCGV
jgi:hypothetical protein